MGRSARRNPDRVIRMTSRYSRIIPVHHIGDFKYAWPSPATKPGLLCIESRLLGEETGGVGRCVRAYGG